MPFSNIHNTLKLRQPGPPIHHDCGLCGGRRRVLRSVQGSLRPHHRGPAWWLQAQQ
uniref:Uncharacterized protein n=1 Tax=Callithrix jacchus TaxID=9483 RepID=A0A8I4A4Q1_CALJA